MKYSDELTKEICNYLKAGNTQKDAATLSGISEETFYQWMKRPEFSEPIKKAEQECKARNIAFIQKAAEKTWQAAAWYLERRYNNEYALKQINELNGGIGQNGEREPIRLLINTGSGFIPATVTVSTPPAGSITEGSPSLQGTGMAPESPQDLHGDNGDSQTGTS